MDLRHTLAYLSKLFNISDAELAKATGISTPTISRMRSGGTDDPRLSSLKPIADHFKVSIGQLVGYEPLPRGYSKKFANNQTINLLVPLISWVQASSYNEVVDKLNSTVWHEWVGTNAILSESSYALKIDQGSLSPPFVLDDIIIVDPIVQPRDQDHVIIKPQNTTSSILRQWISEANKVWLKPLQSNFETKVLNENDKICGVVQQIQLMTASQKRGR